MSGAGNLTSWAKQGVLLLNNVLTVRAHEANSHKKKGWEFVTDSIVQKLNERDEMIIFVFWGNNAKSKEALVTNPNHIVLKAPHPSPLSAYHGFFGCGHFSKINDILKEKGLEEINWQL
jgi:uracil-DNA glycosylase